MSAHDVVLMVDDKKRDLMVSSMIAHALRQRGITCHLEPLEAYRAALAVHRPAMMIFNHLTASHLVEYSKRIAGMGVLTGVLLSEGLCYDDEERLYNAGKHHKGAHIDFFFSWNQPMKEALEQTGFGQTRIEVTGPPRFDTYFKPWSKLFQNSSPFQSSRPKILLCTNFGLAKFHDLPREQVDQFFSPWTHRIPIYRDYWSLVNSHYNSSRRIFEYLNPIVQSGRFEIIVRPHPREELARYQEWLDSLEPANRKYTRIDSNSNITRLILNCDLHLSCENCTTAMEAWIAGKPTIELIFDRHPVLYLQAFADLQATCDNSKNLVELIETQLASPDQSQHLEDRKKHLAKWCGGPSGQSVQRIADLIAAAVEEKEKTPPDWSQLDLQDRRRSWKLQFFKALGLAYHFDPFLPIKKLLFPKKYSVKHQTYKKSIKPRDICQMRRLLEKVL